MKKPFAIAILAALTAALETQHYHGAMSPIDRYRHQNPQAYAYALQYDPKYRVQYNPNNRGH